MRTLFFVFALASLVATSAFAQEGLVERKIEGKDAALLTSSMQESGSLREPFVPSIIPSDHPVIKPTSDFVFKMESILCREKRCAAFRVSTEKMKELDRFFHRIGVKETVPPMPSNGKRLKPFLFIVSLVCGAENKENTPKTCFVTAHFKPKKN